MINEQTEVLLKELVEILKPRNTSVGFYTSTTTGSIPANSLKVYIKNTGATAATITSNSTTYSLAASETIDLNPGPSRYNNLITFDATGTTIKYIVYY